MAAAPSKKRILIVEDDVDILFTVEHALIAAGFECSAACTGPEALVLVTHFKPDLVLLDLNIPVLDGLDVCLRLKNDQQTAHIKIVMVTARAKPNDHMMGREVGADGYITKPFEMDDVIAKVTALLI